MLHSNNSLINIIYKVSPKKGNDLLREDAKWRNTKMNK